MATWHTRDCKQRGMLGEQANRVVDSTHRITFAGEIVSTDFILSENQMFDVSFIL